MSKYHADGKTNLKVVFFVGEALDTNRSMMEGHYLFTEAQANT